MLTFNNLQVTGYCSIENFEINLNQKGITLIQGVNGTGKTTLLSSIVWTLYGTNTKGFSDVRTWEKIRPKDYKGVLCSINWVKDGHYYKVTRCQEYKDKVDGARGDNRLLFYIDAELTNTKKKPLIQAEIVKALGMSYELFMASIMFGQGLKRILQESSNDQKSVFEEIFDLSWITKAQDKTKTRFKELESQYQGALNSYRETKRSLEAVQNERSKQLDRIKHFEASQDVKLKKLRKQLKENKQKLKSLPEDTVNLDKLLEISESLKAGYETLKNKVKDLQGKLGDITVPVMITHLTKLFDEKDYKGAKAYLDSIGHSMSQLDVCRLHKETYMEQARENDRAIFEAKARKKQSDYLSGTMQLLKEEMQSIKEEELPYLDNTLDDKEANLTKSLEECISNGEILKRDLETLSWAYKDPLGPNGLKAYIFENFIEELNEILTSYASTTGILIRYQIDLEGARKDFGALIYIDGVEATYDELSGGQKQLVHMAMALAMNELSGKNHPVNVTFMDEVFENLSYDNIEIVVSLLRKSFRDRNLFLITHQPSLPVGNSRVITTHRERGLTQYTW